MRLTIVSVLVAALLSVLAVAVPVFAAFTVNDNTGGATTLVLASEAGEALPGH